MTQTTDTLKTVLADTYALYLKTQNYHWNVEGPRFKELHDLFELQYTELVGAIDVIAELIRALGEKAPGSFAAYSAHTTIAEGDEGANAEQMIAQLHQDNQIIQKTLQSALAAAEAENDAVVADAMTQRLAVHQKNTWMLGSMR